MLEEPYYYVEEVLQFRKITKEKRKQHIQETKKQVEFYEKVLSGKIKVCQFSDPDFNVMLNYNKKLLEIMQIICFELGD